MTRSVVDTTRDPRVSDPAWARVAAAYGDLTATLTGREDIVVRIAAQATGTPAPAHWVPSVAQIELDSTLFGTVPPESINPGLLSHRNRVPAAYGAFVHECGHATHSRWLPDKAKNSRALAAAFLLEESRMEHNVIAARPGQRRWLRACIKEIVMDGLNISDDPWGAGTVAALVLARVDGGTLDPDDVTVIEEAVTGLLGQDVVDTLTRIWQEAHRTDDTDFDTMLRLGTQWCEALNVDANADTPNADGDPDSEPDSGPGDPGQEGSSTLRDLIREATEAISANETEEITGPAPTPAPARTETIDPREQADNSARAVFSQKCPPASFTVTKRAPLPDERAAANKLAQRLRRARHRDRIRVTSPSLLPPGRLNGRGAIAAEVQTSMGKPVTATPWKQVRRRHTDQPELRVGIAVDVSGSMRAAQQPIASAAWIFGNAVTRAGGTFATVAYGSGVIPVVKPNERPATVTEVEASHGTENFVNALNALDGALGLTWGTGARLLVVVSDGHYRPDQRSNGTLLARRLTDAGCGILWLHFGDVDPMPGCTLQRISADLLAAAVPIGDAAVKAVSAA